MIDVKKAIAAAVEKMNELYDGQLSDLLLEEVERSEDDHHWLVTLSCITPRPASPQNPLQQLNASLRIPVRLYKVLKIDADTGDFISMKIREAQAA